VLAMLKGNSVWEKIENYCLLALFVGAIVLSAGLGLSALSPSGLPAVLAMTGGFVVISATTIMVFSWLAKDLKE